MRYYAFTLPFPPSLNRYWRATLIGGFARNILSRDGRAYKEKCVKAIAAIVSQRKLPVLDNGCLFHGRVRVNFEICPPSRRKYDIDNFLKATLDALTASKVWLDDSLVDELHVKRGPIVRGGELRAEIWDA